MNANGKKGTIDNPIRLKHVSEVIESAQSRGETVIMLNLGVLKTTYRLRGVKNGEIFSVDAPKDTTLNSLTYYQL